MGGGWNGGDAAVAAGESSGPGADFEGVPADDERSAEVPGEGWDVAGADRQRRCVAGELKLGDVQLCDDYGREAWMAGCEDLWAGGSEELDCSGGVCGPEQRCDAGLRGDGEEG